MRTPFVCALAATVVGCSCYAPPQASLDACMASGLACLDRSSLSQRIEPEPAALDARLSTPKTRSKIAARTEKPPSAHARHKTDLAMTTTKSATPAVEPPAVKVEPPAAKVEPAAAKVEPAAAKVEPAAAKVGPAAAKVEPAAVKVEPPAVKVEPAAAKVEPAAAKVGPAAAKVEPPAAKVEPAAAGRPAETSDQVIARAKTTIAAKLDDPRSAEFGEMKRATRTNTLGKSVDTICGYVKGKKASGESTGDRPFLYLVKDDEAYVVDGPATSIAATAYRNICN
jgi:hypothetical protein